MTYTLVPADRAEGALLWVKLGLVSFAGVVIPLTVPRAYVPLDPEVRRSSCFSLCLVLIPDSAEPLARAQP